MQLQPVTCGNGEWGGCAVTCGNGEWGGCAVTGGNGEWGDAVIGGNGEWPGGGWCIDGWKLLEEK